MSTGGGNTTTTTNTSSIPEWLRAPTERMVERGEAASNAPYQQYTGDRVAGFSPMQEQAFEGVSGMYSNPYANQQYGQAGASLGNAQNIANSAALAGASYQPGAFQAASYNPAMAGASGYGAVTIDPNDPRARFDAAQAQAAGQVGWDQFGSDAAQRYMSPYQQSVTDVAKQKAALEGQQMMNRLGATAAQNGGFGGARFGLEQAQAMRDIGSNMSNIQVQGSQSAYDRAMQQFNADQQRRAAAEQFNVGNEQALNLANAGWRQGAGQFNAGSFQQAQLANQGALNRAAEFGAGASNTAGLANALAQNRAGEFGANNWMTAQQLAEQSRQFGAGLGLQGADLAARTGLSAADQYRNLGTAGQNAEVERINMLNAAGVDQQNLAQKYADTGYQNFTEARDYDRNSLNFMNNLLRGTQAGGTSTTQAPGPSTASQLAGTGLSAYAMWKMFGGG